MEYQHLRVEKNNHVATVTLNRPQTLNALSVDLMQELCDVADSFLNDVQTRAIVFTGAGKIFSSGADLSDSKLQSLQSASLLEKQRNVSLGQRLVTKLQAINQLTIAAINGGALGGACVVASALDFRIASDDSFFAYPEIDFGMNLSWHGLPLCVRLVGPSRAKQLVILGHRQTAQTLQEWGFVDSIVPADKLVESALGLAREYASKPPIAAQMIKRSVNAVSGALDQAIMHMDTDQFILTNLSKDFAEGISAFQEGRDPEFTGE